MKPSSSNSKIAVDHASGKWGIADETGTWIVTPEFDKIEPGDFTHSYKVENSKLYGQINPNGGWIIGPFLKMPSQAEAAEVDGVLVSGTIPEADSPCESLAFSLSSYGVLTISGEGVVRGVYDLYKDYNPAIGEEDVDVRVRSKFKDFDFHTVVIKNGIIGLGDNCLSGCRKLKRIILPSTLEFAYSELARDTDLEFSEEEGLLYLGNKDNPHFILLRTSSPNGGRPFIIPEDVFIVALGAFSYRGQKSANDITDDLPEDEKLPFPIRNHGSLKP